MRNAIALVLLIAAAILVIRWLGPEAPDLDWLRAQISDIKDGSAGGSLAMLAGFFALYVIVAALSLPFAVWMTLAAGALFGFWWGLVVVSFASSIGATLAFLAARHFLRDWIRSRFAGRLQSIDAGLERDGAFYLFTLRLVPAIPFFVVNLAMGLSSIGWLTFYLVSQAGMLAATAVYVNAGTQLAELQSLDGILSPGLVLALVLLGIFPWLARGFVALIARRKVYSRWRRPKRFDRNLIVIGGGAAGLVSAYVAAAVRARVTLIEADMMGGDCLNHGCVPSKSLIRSSKLAHQMRNADRLGLTASDPAIDFGKVFARIGSVIAAIEPHDSADRYRGLGVDVRQAHAQLVDPWTVEMTYPDGRRDRLTARAIILATGAAPVIPPLPGLQDVGYLTTETMWAELGKRSAPPGRLVVLGGGPIGAELAQSLQRLGSQVTLIEQADRLLIREDVEVSDFARHRLEADGVVVRTGHKAIACGLDAGGKWIETEADGARHRFAFDDMIIAVGRKARLTGFGLEQLGIPADRVIATNDYLQTIYPNIYAAGDAAGPYQFTHTAAHQAWYAAVNALFGFIRPFRADYRVIPWTTFLDPEIARVGLSEAEAKSRGIAYEVTRYGIDDLDRAIADGTAAGFVKVLTQPGRDRILGAVIVGEHAGDLLAEFVLAMKAGLGLGKILATLHSYPTLAEANKFVAGEWRKARLNDRVLSLAARLHDWRRGA